MASASQAGRCDLFSQDNGSLRAEGEAAANGGAAGKASEEVPPVVPEPLVAVDGDIVLLHYDCRDDAGEMIDSTRERGEPLTLELGVGEIVGNPLVQALETAVRSHGVGDVVELQLQGGDYKPELIFKVPTDHPEIERLQGRYRSTGSGPRWSPSLRRRSPSTRNNMLAGLQRRITVEILDIDRAAPGRAVAMAQHAAALGRAVPWRGMQLRAAV
eukprot:jgi/Ulvmu1/7098/UM034_0001.1